MYLVCFIDIVDSADSSSDLVSIIYWRVGHCRKQELINSLLLIRRSYSFAVPACLSFTTPCYCFFFNETNHIRLPACLSFWKALGISLSCLSLLMVHLSYFGGYPLCFERIGYFWEDVIGFWGEKSIERSRSCFHAELMDIMTVNKSFPDRGGRIDEHRAPCLMT